MIDFLKCSHGAFFPSAMRFVGIVLCFTVVLIPLGVLIYFLEQGAEFKPKEKLYRHYVGIFGLNLGKWKSYEAYKDLAYLAARVTTSTSSRVSTTSQTEVQHNLFLLTPNHRSKVLAYVYKDKHAVNELKPEELAESLGVKYTTYAPQVSAATRARRR